MDKWADYVIVAVQYDTNQSQIVKVKRCPDLGNELGKANVETREDVMESMGWGKTHVTAYSKDGMWTRGDNVGIVNIGGVNFIRTDGNETKADNLGELPEF